MNWRRGFIRLWLGGWCISLLCSVGAAEPNKVVYELQERCAKAAREYFLRYYIEGTTTLKAGWRDDRYESNYNTSDNRCYLLTETFVHFTRDKSQEPRASMMRESSLIDVLANKLLGSFSWNDDPSYYTGDGPPRRSTCDIINQTCSSEAQWKDWQCFTLRPHTPTV